VIFTLHIASVELLPVAKSKRKTPSVLICEKTGREFPYRGFGRPPRFHPDVKKEMDRERRAAAYEKRQAAKGKTVTRRAA
jgi:hypothetical protein